MKTFKQYLQEARRNPHLNPKVKPMDVAAMHANNPRVFVTFTQIPKVGLNPQSKWNTPIGIYSYPVSYVYEKAQNQGTVYNSVPFAGKQKYVTFFEQTGTILDVDNPDRRLIQSFRKVAKEYTDKYLLDDFEQLKGHAFEIANVHTTAGNMWALGHVISDRIETETNKNKVTIWNKMFLEAGIDCVLDRGNGIIHPSEPYQAVHFSRKNIDIIEMMENKNNRGVDLSQISFKDFSNTRNSLKSIFEYAKDELEDVDDILSPNQYLRVIGHIIGYLTYNLGESTFGIMKPKDPNVIVPLMNDFISKYPNENNNALVEMIKRGEGPDGVLFANAKSMFEFMQQYSDSDKYVDDWYKILSFEEGREAFRAMVLALTMLKFDTLKNVLSKIEQKYSSLEPDGVFESHFVSEIFSALVVFEDFDDLVVRTAETSLEVLD